MNTMAVIIATRNRPDALARYALPSLAASDFRNFVCVIWDASDDDSSRLIVERERERERESFRRSSTSRRLASALLLSATTLLPTSCPNGRKSAASSS
jgi:glycosyltransferase involved in cell wall biosynthesis